MNISYGVRINQPESMEQRTLAEIVALIKTSSQIKKDVAHLRTIDDRAIRQVTKKQTLPWFTTNRYKSKDKKKKARRHGECFSGSEGMIFDLDHIPEGMLEKMVETIKEKVKGVTCIFRSPSGDGVKFITKFDKVIGHDYYTSIYTHYTTAYTTLLEHAVDAACKDVARGCYMSYDEDIFYDEDVEPIPVDFVIEYLNKDKKSASASNLASYQYDSSTQGRDDILSIMLNEKDYSVVSEDDHLVRLARPGKTSTSCTVSDGENETMPIIGLYMFTTSDEDFDNFEAHKEKSGRSTYRPFEVLMRTRFKNDLKGAEAYIRECGFKDVAYESKEVSLNVIWAVLSERFKFRVDVRDHILEVSEFSGKWQVYDDIISAVMFDYIEGKTNRLFPISTILSLITSRALKHDRMRDWVTGLEHYKVSEGSENVTVASYLQLSLGIMNDMQIAIFRKWLISAIATIMEENSANEICIVLKGKQRIGKTRWIRHLCPPQLKDKYYEGRLANDKDSVLKVAKNFIINMDEFETTTSKAAVGNLKSMMSSTVIKERAPYGRAEATYKKYASFMASVNEDEFLRDVTGNSRFPVYDMDERKTDLKWMYGVDINALWKEAYHAWSAGETSYLNDAELAHVGAVAQDYVMEGYMEEDMRSRFMFFNKNDWDSYARRNGTTREYYIMVKVIVDAEGEDEDRIMLMSRDMNDAEVKRAHKDAFSVAIQSVTTSELFRKIAGDKVMTPNDQRMLGITLKKLGSYRRSVREGLTTAKKHSVVSVREIWEIYGK